MAVQTTRLTALAHKNYPSIPVSGLHMVCSSATIAPVSGSEMKRDVYYTVIT